MRGHDDGDAELAVHTRKHEQELLDGVGVKLSGRLIKQQHPGAQREHGSQVDKLLLTSREVLGFRPDPRLDAEEMRDLGDAPAHLVRFDTQVLQTERQLVPNGIAHYLRRGILHDIADDLGGFQRGYRACGGIHGLIDRMVCSAAGLMRLQGTTEHEDVAR